MSLFSRLTGKDDELVKHVQQRYAYVMKETMPWVEEADRLRDAGNLDAARDGYQKTFDLFHRLEEDQGGIVPPEFVQLSAMMLERIGDIDLMKMELASALRSFLQALERYQASVGPSRSTVQVLGKIGDLYESANDLDKAREYYEAGRETAGEVDLPPEIRTALLNNVGRVYVMQGDVDRGLKSLEDAVAIDRSEGTDAMEAAVHLNNLGELYQMMGDLERAERCLEEAVQLQSKA
ncbi:MAG: tetratricopeptide repeat protein [Gaiellales bacterium]